MNREKAIEIYNDLKAKCPGLILAGSVLEGKEKDIYDLDLIWVGRIFPLHKLPIKDIDKNSLNIHRSNILRFKFYGEQIDIHRVDEKNLPTLISQLSGHHLD